MIMEYVIYHEHTVIADPEIIFFLKIMEHVISHGHTATTVSQHGYGTHIYHRHTVTADPKKKHPKNA